jgi:hypothetical protein
MPAVRRKKTTLMAVIPSSTEPRDPCAGTVRINGGLVLAENRRSRRMPATISPNTEGRSNFLTSFPGKFWAGQKSCKREEHNHHIMWRQMIHGFTVQSARVQGTGANRNMWERADTTAVH